MNTTNRNYPLLSGLGGDQIDDDLAAVKQAFEMVDADVAAILVAQAATGTKPYDPIFSVYERPTAGEVVFRMLIVRELTIPANFAGSLAKSQVAAQAGRFFSIKKDGVEVATAGFAAGSANAIFSEQAAVVFPVGSLLTVVAPLTQDNNLSDIDFAIKASVI